MKTIFTFFCSIAICLFIFQTPAFSSSPISKMNNAGIANLNVVFNRSNQVRLNWVVTSHEDINYYIIGHSMDNVSFDSVGTMMDGNASQYIFDDTHLSPGVNYYRIKIVFADGTFDYSNVATVSNTAKLASSASAPSLFQVAINVYSQAGEALFVRLRDMAGKLIESSSCRVGAGNSKIKVNIPLSLARGLYVLDVMGADGAMKITKRLFKQ